MISSNRLEPKSAGQIKATVDTSGKSGNLVKHITIYSNDRTTPVRTLTITIDVTEKVAVTEKVVPKEEKK